MDGRPPGFVYWVAMKHVVLPFLLLSVLVVAALSCDKATPTAPSGSSLSISANPTRIGLNGSSTITITGREPNGSAMRQGTEIRLAASLGTITPLVVIDHDGNATATLRGDGRRGPATVTAQTGTVGGGGGSGGSSSGSLSVSTTVQIGEPDETKPTVLLSANPSTIPVGTGSATVTVIGRNADGTPVAAGQTVILTTTLGQLRNSRPVTDSSGTATARLDAGNVAGEATITAILGTSAEATTKVTIRDAATAISVDATPRTINEGGGTITVSAFVTNSEGLPLQGAQVRFRSEVGTFSSTTDFTDSQGLAEVTLTVTDEQLDDFVGRTFEITAETPSGGGDFIEDTVDVTISGR
jgi:hypothetical protein